MSSNKASLMKKRPNLGTIKYNLIKEILYLNKSAVKIFGVEELTEDELYEMKINNLKNVKTELIVQLGIKHKFNFGHRMLV